ncbi:CobW family GTP-binding protein [Paraburkholderia rhynchosiae]|uniref:Cobalamin biosynthesis protein CobW n=1 Tax=Paraburkholderia rhynchosiae TaxID=487049 RepID=A0A2N7VZ65_9BURK|nr:CobW family GTP-binding protein [Paraburkholderia rhynchosiae]PMS22435.1 cobalamin biosynthesis protein CobW [Paraburkholderia rhynchosiae]CAB3738048.1 Putative metal chaperone YciC [Paraburkholderia rhynchosiae]
MNRIPLVVVGGYLGAGKTTLLNHVLRNAGTRRITVLVNDFGSINIDASLIRERTADVINLENGCVCCSIGGRLVEALLAISSRADAPDLLIIEASGVSDPLRIAQIGLLDRAFRLDGIVVLVDAERIAETLADPYVGDISRRQIAGATAIVLNKMDLLDRPSREAIVARVEVLASHCVMLQATRGAIPLGLIFDQNVRHARRDTSSAPLTGTPLPLDLTSFSFVTGARLDRTRLKEALQGLSAKLLRAKGFVRLEGGGALHELHVVGSRVVMSRRPDRTSAESSIVLIGRFSAEDEMRARAALEAAEVDQS